MKRIAILFSLLALLRAGAALTEGPDDWHGFDSSSYDELGLSAYLSGYYSFNFPAYTNHWTDFGRSGSSIEADAETQLFKWAAPSAAACSGNLSILFFNNDNGGGTYADTLVWNTNFCLFPGRVWNGSSYAILSGWATTHSNLISYFPSGALPHDSADGDGGEFDRDRAAHDFAAGKGMPAINTWSIWNLGVNTDQAGARWFWDNVLNGSHPSKPGVLCVVINWLLQEGAETNINSYVIDYNTGLHTATNHCVISGESKTHATLSWTWHADRHAFPYDVPEASMGLTNDARQAFQIIPSFTNRFFEVFQVANAPDGLYRFSMDGHFDRNVTGQELRSGVNLFHDFNNQLGKQRLEGLARTREQNGQDRTNLLEHSAGDAGTLGTQDAVNLRSNENQQYDNNGLRGDAMIASVASIVTAVHDGYDASIWQAAQPTNHTILIERLYTRYKIR